MPAPARRPRGRQAQARRNDDRVLAAALSVLAVDPAAPMSAVAQRADVGQASLYRRYPSREHLLIAVCTHGIQRIENAARTALTDPDPGRGVARFLTDLVDGDDLRLSALLGTFAPPPELFVLAAAANRVIAELAERAVAAGAIRPGVTGADLTMIATQVGAVSVGDPARTAQLRRRYLSLALQGLTRADTGPLPGPAPDAAELEAPWRATVH